MRYKEIMFEHDDIPVDGAEVDVSGHRGLLSRNTIPGQKPWRVTWFDDNLEDDGGVCGHVDISVDQAKEILSGTELEYDLDGWTLYIQQQ